MSLTDVRTTTEHVLARVAEIPPGEGRAFVAGGTQVAVFRLRDGSLHATEAACPHAGGPLADGQTDVDVLVCPLHQYAYRWSDGSPTSGAAPIRLFPVREVDGQVVVELSPRRGQVRGRAAGHSPSGACPMGARS